MRAERAVERNRGRVLSGPVARGGRAAELWRHLEATFSRLLCVPQPQEVRTQEQQHRQQHVR
jgi:hypothetical protein